ncbi:MAG: response regulator transcription factor, partial [Nitrospiraceae bacterium]
MSLEIVQIIEDEPLHARLLDHSLRRARYRTNVAVDGVTGLADVKRLLPAVILLDLMLPGISGHEVCRDIRNTPGIQQTPIIMITALGSEEDRIGGIEMGADDYITKPFSPREVVSRVGALFRRSRQWTLAIPPAPNSSLSIEDHYLIVSLRGKQLTVSREEWSLLRFLVGKPNQIITVDELVSVIWEDDVMWYRHVDTLVRALRTKLENTFSGSIEILPPVGYRYVPHR